MKIQKNHMASSKKSETRVVSLRENPNELLNSNGSLRSFTIITFENAAEFGFASNSVCLANIHPH